MTLHRFLLLNVPLLVIGQTLHAGLPEPGAKYHLLFATTNLYSITSIQTVPPGFLTFGNIAGGDWQVTSAAYDARLPGMTAWNQMDARYQSILSISGNRAIDRMVIEGAVYNTVGTRLATNKADLFDGALEAPVDYDEYSTYLLEDPDVWTACTSSGLWTGDSCGEWNNTALHGRVGDAFVSDGTWISAGFTKPCSQSARLYGVSPALTAPLWGDFDENGSVDGRDFLVWQRTVGTSPNPFPPSKPWDETHYRSMGAYAYYPVDPANPVEFVHVNTDAWYLQVWQEHYGMSLPVEALLAVPEPATVFLALGLVAVFNRRRTPC